MLAIQTNSEIVELSFALVQECINMFLKLEGKHNIAWTSNVDVRYLWGFLRETVLQQQACLTLNHI